MTFGYWIIPCLNSANGQKLAFVAEQLIEPRY